MLVYMRGRCAILVSVVIVAAGESRRMQGMGDKVLLSLLGNLCSFAGAVFRLAAVDNCSRHQSGCPPGERCFLPWVGYLPRVGWRQPAGIGLSRLAGLPRAGLVAIHDAARPCLREEDALAVIAAARQQEQLSGYSVTDTVKRVQAGRVIECRRGNSVGGAGTQVFGGIGSRRPSPASQTGSATDDAELVARVVIRWTWCAVARMASR